jgi:hypothetical protein
VIGSNKKCAKIVRVNPIVAKVEGLRPKYGGKREVEQASELA